MNRATPPPTAETASHPEAPLKYAGDPLAELAFATRADRGDLEAARAWARVSELTEALDAARMELARERRRCRLLEQQLERMRG
jgi:hypothetical protein